MMPPRSSFSGPGVAFGRNGRDAFSLVEILLVSVVIGLFLALAVPGLVVLTPSRKSAIHEVSGFLENARARAIASQTAMVVAFADGAFPGEGAYRSYALFALEAGEDGSPGEHHLSQLSPWRNLPPGMVFAHRGHFEVPGGTAFRTLLDVPERRAFPMPPAFSGGDDGTASLPYLHFGPDGGICFPAFTDADALHLGVIEGSYSKERRRIELSATRPGSKGRGTYANGECLEIGFYTGRSRLLSD